MQLHGGAAIFELIGFFHRGEGQLAFFADGHKADVELMRNHRTQNKAARIQASHYIRAQVAVHIAVDKSICHHAKDLGVLQQRGDIPKLHARRRPVGHSTNMVAQIVVDAERGLHEVAQKGESVPVYGLGQQMRSKRMLGVGSVKSAHEL